MVCKRCNADLSENSKYCIYCGCYLDEENSSIQEDNIQQVESHDVCKNVSGEENEQSNVLEEENKKNISNKKKNVKKLKTDDVKIQVNEIEQVKKETPAPVKSRKKSPLVTFLLVIVIIALVSAVMFLAFKLNENITGGGFFKDSDNNNDTSDIILKDGWNGLYEYQNMKLKVFKLSDEEIYFYLVEDNEVLVEGNASLKDGNSAKWYKNWDSVIIESLGKKANVAIELNGEDTVSFTFDKIKNYEIENYYSEHLGDMQYVDSKFNGEFVLNFNGSLGKPAEYILKIYQKDKDSAIVQMNEYDILEDGSWVLNGSVLRSMKVTNDGLLYENVEWSSVENDYTEKFEINIKLENDRLVLSTLNIREDGYLKEINGNYSKKKSYNMNDIITIFG